MFSLQLGLFWVNRSNECFDFLVFKAEERECLQWVFGLELCYLKQCRTGSILPVGGGGGIEQALCKKGGFCLELHFQC